MWDLSGIDWTLIGAVLIALLTALKILDHFFGWVGAVWFWVRNLFRRRPNSGTSHIPKQTVIILPSQQQHTPFWWHMGGQRGKPSMQIVARLQVTNIADGDVLLSGVKLRKPNVTGHIIVENFETGIFGMNAIQRGRLAEAMIDLWIQPPVKNAGEVFMADLYILDQFGNEHWLKRVEFKYQ
jgi:hypothetical protein